MKQFLLVTDLNTRTSYTEYERTFHVEITKFLRDIKKITY